jgi:hypothetical protein
MSTKHKDAVAQFDGSTGDEDYLNPPDKKGMATIAKALKGAKDKDPVTLPGLADRINHEYEMGEMMRRQTCAQFIEVGRLLNIARAQFTSNTKFGAWRKKMINFSQSHVQRLMQVATEFGDVEDATLLPFGTLAVLTNASDDLKGKVIADAKDGKTVTRAEVTEAKKAEKGESPPESADDFADSIQEKAEVVIEDEPPEEEWQVAQRMLDKPLLKRLSAISNIEGSRNPAIQAHMLFGLPPYYDGMPSTDVVSYLYDAYCTKIEQYVKPEDESLYEAYHDKLTQAHDILFSIFKEGV